MKKRIISLFLVVAFVVSVPLVGLSAQNPIKGVALGDSVAAFYGVEEKDGFVSQLSALLNAKKIDNEFKNLAVSGYDTQALLVQLTEKKVLAEIKKADIITLNIGGNNILTPLIGILLDDLKALKINDFADMQKAPPVVLMAFILKRMTEAQMTSLMKGVALFEEDFPEIIKILHKTAPNAKILVNTVYNPIPPMLGLYKASEILVPLINEVIVKNAEELAYTVVDVYTVYQDSVDVITNFDIASGSVDIHPNASGHTLIAEAVAEEIVKIYTPNTKTKK